jgi:hypothetical protein
MFSAKFSANRSQRSQRRGQARTTSSVAKDLAAFVEWVNTECQHRGHTNLIPDDGRGHLTTSRFRRTLAWFIRRRPRGLIAASIQYAHLHTRMLQGYAGTYESGFPDEYAFEDWLYRLENLAEDEQALSQGEHVSGPAADAYRYRVTAAGREFAGRVLTSDRQARDLLGNQLLQIHHGMGMTCVPTRRPRPANSVERSTTQRSPRTRTTAAPSASTWPGPTATSHTSNSKRVTSPRSWPIPSPRRFVTPVNSMN